MIEGIVWVVLIALALIGVFFLMRDREHKRRQTYQIYQEIEQNRAAAVTNALMHFGDLLKKGIQVKMIAGGPPDIALRKDEQLLCAIPRTTLVEPRAVRAWRSSYGGPTIRVAKGLSFRLGASSGTSESHTELRPLDTGSLVLTNKRLMFIGSQQTRSVTLNKVIDTEAYTDALAVHREGKQRTEYYQLNKSDTVDYEYDGKMLSTPLDGRLVKLVLDQVIGH